MFSIVIPVYRNAEFVSQLVEELEQIAEAVYTKHAMLTEAVFVVDASPDDSYARLSAALPEARFNSQLLLHSRNFGSFASIRSGLGAAKGQYFAVIAADLQEPPEILLSFLEELASGQCEVVVGTRLHRHDPFISRLMSGIFWSLYRRLIIREIPKGGVDIFGCCRIFRDELLKLSESNSSLVGLIYWLGFRRKEIGYVRRKRMHGHSAWSISKRVSYLLDSVFSFTDLPVRILTVCGALGTAVAVAFGALVLILRLMGMIEVPGYAPTVLIIAFFGALNIFGIGLIGSYAWRAYENTKGRPLSVICSSIDFDGAHVCGPDGAPRQDITI